MLLNLGGVAIHCTSQLSEFAAMLFLSGAETLKVFQVDQLQALAMLFLNVYKSGFMITNIFLGLWLFPLGYLVFKSGFLPRILGILLIIDGFAMLIWVFQFFLFSPGYEIINTLCLTAGFIAEGSLCLWLLIKGVKDLGLWTKQQIPPYMVFSCREMALKPPNVDFVQSPKGSETSFNRG